jgi:LCP family protein required for cell wall assembly
VTPSEVDGASERPLRRRDPRRSDRRRSHRHTHRHPWLRRVAWVAGLLVVALVVTLGVAVWKLNGNVSRVDVSKALGTDRPTPTAKTEALNILLLGSDTRADLSTDEYGQDTIEGGAHSDTNILVHISADRQNVLAVSIPRDSMVPAPADCRASTPKSAWVVRQWNYNFNKGGPGCTIRTLEGNTGVFVDHYAVVNFEGFATMVDALGGVEVCTPIAINDPASELHLTPGRHLLDGRDALGYVRVRKTITGGSDLNRINRQQAFLSSVVQKAVSTDMLKRPDRLFSFLNAATKALTTDPQLGLGEMTDVARSLQNVGAENIQFVTVPTEEYPKDHNRVQWTSAADLIWKAIRDDRAIGEESSPSPSPSGSPSATASAEPLTVSPARISVRILNGSGIKGLASQEAQALRVQGFAAVTVGDSPGASTGVLVEYSAHQAEAARTVAAAFPGAQLEQNSTLGDVIQVTLGTGAPHVAVLPNRVGSTPLPTPSVSASAPPQASGSASPSPSISTRSADESICQ